MGYIEHPAGSHDMREWDGINRTTGFEVMNRSVDMSTGMGAHMQVADQVVPVALLPENRWGIARIYEDVFRERTRDIDYFHRSTHSIRTSR